MGAGIEELCRHIYKETEEFYCRIRPHITRDFGYEILYGPPHFKPPVLFIGYQPGGDEHSTKESIALRKGNPWPNDCTYATQKWPLAVKMQSIFNPEFGPDYLLKCVGLNAIFFRAPTMGQYKENFGPVLRKEINSFCKSHIETIVQALQPEKIIFIGLSTAKFFGPVQSDLKRKRPYNANLTMTGSVAGIPALGILHLSGARLSAEERKIIFYRIKKFQMPC
jgi:hypothetical protein